MTCPELSFDHVHLVSPRPLSTARWYVEKFDGRIERQSDIQGAPQIFVRLFGVLLIIRGQRSGEAPVRKTGLQWGIDHFGLLVRGDLDEYCSKLKERGVSFIVEPTPFGASSRIAYVEDPDGVAIELLKRT